MLPARNAAEPILVNRAPVEALESSELTTANSRKYPEGQGRQARAEA
jgi:hypothetical protein